MSKLTFEQYLVAVIRTEGKNIKDILQSASSHLTVQELKLLSSCSRLSSPQFKEAAFNKLWEKYHA